MRFQLFDDEDLKKLEDHMARALVRALRTVLKEGLIAGYRPPAPESFADSHPAPQPATATPAAPPQPLAPNRPEWAQPKPAQEPEPPVLFGMRAGEPQSGHGYRQMHPLAQATIATPARELAAVTKPPEPASAKRRSMAEFCKSVGEKPHGYITTDEAHKLIDVPEQHAPASLRSWIQAGTVTGVIVCGIKGMTPTKGLPGRLYVDKQQVIARDKLRAQNAEAMRRAGKGSWTGASNRNQHAQAAAE